MVETKHENMDKVKQKILVCGSTGFIGRNIAESLSENRACEVYGTFLDSAPLKSKKIKMLKADLTSEKDVKRVLSGIDIVIQAAATTSGVKDIFSKPHYHVTDNAVMNALIFKNAVELKVKHLVFFSCTIMYQSSEIPIKETDFDANKDILGAYFGAGWTKICNEKMCEFYSRTGNTKFTVIRHSNIYGPYDKYDLEHSHVFGATMTKVMTAKDGDKITVWGEGKEERDLLHVADLVDLVKAVVSKQNSKFELINAGSGSSIGVGALVKKIIQISGKNLNIEFDSSKPNLNTRVSLDSSKARDLFGWNPKIILDDGISKTIEWYRSFYKHNH
ncbi:MAG: NAD-dependent epimerase/dehydratase family protein [Elusimicrobiota bacterium]